MYVSISDFGKQLLLSDAAAHIGVCADGYGHHSIIKFDINVFGVFCILFIICVLRAVIKGELLSAKFNRKFSFFLLLIYK